MTERTVKVKGLNDLKSKLDIDFLAQPEIDAARDAIVARVMRPRKGLGAKLNTLTATVSTLGAEVQTTKRNPRNTAKEWGRKNEAAVKAMAPRVMASAVKKIEQRWAEGGAA